jgi:hypothetical protein
MIIWLLVFIPVITILVLLFKYSRNVTWWEYIIHFGVALLLIAVMKVVGEKSQTHDTEYWGDLIQSVEYYEPYSIWDHETCTRQVACGTDSNGNTQYCTETYDCSHLDSYPARWRVITTTDWKFGVSRDFYEFFVKRFRVAPCFQNMHHEKECGFGDYIVKDGGMYYAQWTGSPETSYAVAKTHTYENKVQCSHSVFNYQTVDKKVAKASGLYDYPEIRDNAVATILGGEEIAGLDSAEAKLHYLNGYLGPKKQLRVWVLIFKDKPLSIGKLQEAYWKGGNKNEFVITIGMDKQNHVSWCYPFSWTEVSELKINVRNYVMEKNPLYLVELSDYLYSELEAKWVRKQFKDFSYLTVEPPLWAIIVAFVLQIIFNVVYSIWAVRNEYGN